MSKMIWCGILVLGLGASAAVFTWRHQANRDCCSQVAANLTLPPSPTPARQPAIDENLPDRFPTIPIPVDDVIEPIVARPEPLEALPEANPTALLPTSGGAEESEAGLAPAPRPDRESRRMPYADEARVGAVDALRLAFWLIPTANPFLLPSRMAVDAAPAPVVPSDAAEESAEPTTIDSGLPAMYHPPHCPFGGHCPYPSSNYRYLQPRR